MKDDENARFDAFLDAFWKDVDGDRVRPIDEYLATFPGFDDQIRSEYVAYERIASSGDSPDAAAPDSPASADLARLAARAAPIAMPQRIGRYVVERRLGAGGMGVVYLGSDPELRRPVVLKTISVHLTSESTALKRLKREARIASRLDHDGICPVLDVVEEEGRIFVVMPFIKGDTLADRLQRARVLASDRPDDRYVYSVFADDLVESGESAGSGGTDGDLRPVVRLMEKIARAVHFLNEAGIVHRDLKPGNVMIRPNGDPVVLDFGLAIDASSADASRLTREGDNVGTPLYMAPEQVEGRLDDIDVRTDVYALGLILYELLTLRAPFAAPSRDAIYKGILGGAPTPPRKLNAAIPRDLDAVCLKAMALERERRYPNALAFADDLRRVRTLRPTDAKPASRTGRLWRSAKRNPWTTAALAAAALAIVVVLVVWARWQTSRETGDFYRAALRARHAVSKGEQPSDEDLRVLSGVLRDEASRRAFLRNPAEPRHWDDIERRLADLPRGEGDDARSNRLVWPRAGVSETSPVFEFEVPDPGGSEWRFVLTLMSDGSADRRYVIVQRPADRGPLFFRLPALEPLEPGRRYAWTIRLDSERHADVAHLYHPDPATFTVIDPRELARLVDIPSSGHESLDRLLLALSLLSRDLARDALDELDSLPRDVSPDEASYAGLLRAEALAHLGDSEGVATLRRDALAK